jgi:type II secretory ATPase GspE/PulE/Tfp pilus assembly ATPase PilB-like protein
MLAMEQKAATKWRAAYPLTVADERDVQARVLRLFFAWQQRLGIEESDWIPVGRVGPVLVLGSEKGGVPEQWPAWAVQPVHLSEEDAYQLRKEASESFSPAMSGEFIVPDEPIDDDPDLSEDHKCRRFLLNGFIHDHLAWLSIQAIKEQGKAFSVTELYPGYAEAYHFLRHGMPVIDLTGISIGDAEIIPRELTERFPSVVVSDTESTLYIASAEKTNTKAFIDQLKAKLTGALRRKTIINVLGREPQVIRAMNFSGTGRRHVQSIHIEKESGASSHQENSLRINPGSVRYMQLNRTTIEPKDLRDHLILLGIEAGASDLHMEAAYGGGIIRLRIDGELKPVHTCRLRTIQELVAVTKTAIGLDPDRHSTEDHSFSIQVGDTYYKMRASVTPTRYGVQSLVLRLLPKRLPVSTIFDLELPDEEMVTLYETIQRPQGLVVVSGPTGSGKTTTLMACLQEINQPNRKILTFEDPIEYDVEGLIQSEVNEDRGVTYPALMRTALRQDPDVILLGEVRDAESAVLAAEASLTGHLVLTTTHTLSATKTLDRFSMLNVPAGLLAESLVMLVSQRLVKRLSTRNRLTMGVSKRDAELFISAGLPVPDHTYVPKRDESGDPIWAGRLPVCEVIPISEEMRDMIRKGEDSGSIRRIATENGRRTIFQNALMAAASGLTTLAEARKWEGF